MNTAAHTRAPRKGTRGTYQSMHGNIVGFVVSSVEDNLCYAVYDTAPDAKPAPFIWRFKDGLNTLHDWPGKSAPPVANTHRDDNAAYRRDMIDAGRGHLLR